MGQTSHAARSYLRPNCLDSAWLTSARREVSVWLRLRTGIQPITAARFALSVIAMLTLAPFLTVATLVLWAPDHFGGSVDLLSIIVLTFFGLITVPLWATFIPALFLTPLLMDGVSRCDWFRRLPLSAALGLSIPAGMLAGMAVMGIILPWGEDAGGAYVILAWLIASAVSGGATLPVIALLYRFGPQRPQAAALGRISSPSP